MLAKALLVLFAGVSCAALAQPAEDTLANDGTWRARIAGDARSARDARVVIFNFAGHWKELGRKRAGDPCRGAKPFPITVQKTTHREVEFTVWAASVNTACPDFALTLRVEDERTLAGTTSDGREVRLVREAAKRNPRR